jgi:hypothetical protein
MDVFGYEPLYGQKPEPTPVVENADNFLAGLSDLLADVPPDWYERVKGWLEPAFGAFKGDECVDVLINFLYDLMYLVEALTRFVANLNWGVAVLLDLSFHAILSGGVSLLAFFSTLWITSLFYASTTFRSPSRTSPSMAPGWLTSLLPWLSAAFFSLLAHLWWDGIRLAPSTFRGWVIWILLAGSAVLVSFVLGWRFRRLSEQE